MDLYFEFILCGFVLDIRDVYKSFKKFLPHQIVNTVRFKLLINYICHLILDKPYHSMYSVYKI